MIYRVFEVEQGYSVASTAGIGKNSFDEVLHWLIKERSDILSVFHKYVIIAFPSLEQRIIAFTPPKVKDEWNFVNEEL